MSDSAMPAPVVSSGGATTGSNSGGASSINSTSNNSNGISNSRDGIDPGLYGFEPGTNRPREFASDSQYESSLMSDAPTPPMRGESQHNKEFNRQNQNDPPTPETNNLNNSTLPIINSFNPEEDEEESQDDANGDGSLKNRLKNTGINALKSTQAGQAVSKTVETAKKTAEIARKIVEMAKNIAQMFMSIIKFLITPPGWIVLALVIGVPLFMLLGTSATQVWGPNGNACLPGRTPPPGINCPNNDSGGWGFSAVGAFSGQFVYGPTMRNWNGFRAAVIEYWRAQGLPDSEMRCPAGHAGMGSGICSGMPGVYTMLVPLSFTGTANNVLLLSPTAAESMEAMNAAFRAEFGIDIPITNTWRDFAGQLGAYGDGGATPGTSNHGWGLAFDLSRTRVPRSSAQWAWMDQNAGRFGWFSGWTQAQRSPCESFSACHHFDFDVRF